MQTYFAQRADSLLGCPLRDTVDTEYMHAAIDYCFVFKFANLCQTCMGWQ